MNVQQIKEITREWLTMNLEQFPGLCGAHFVGSINSTPGEADFPGYKDVDLHLVLKEGSPALENHGPFMNILETEYRGVILEGGYKAFTEYRSPEVVLGNPEIAHHLTVDSLLYDPEGWLQGLQTPVRQEYARRKWVLDRIGYERQMVERWRTLRPQAQAMDGSGFMEFSLLGYHMTFLSALLCIATLQSPSSNYQKMREILEEHDRRDLFDESMAILGLRDLGSDQVKEILEEGAEAFDLAVRVKRTPTPFQHKLNAHQRRYFVDACHHLLEAGFIEEAAGRAATYCGSSTHVLLTDGAEEVKPKYEALRNRLVELLGMDTQEKRDKRFAQMEHLDKKFFALAENIIERNPGIFD